MVTIVRKLCSAILAALTVFAAGCSGTGGAATEPPEPMTAESLYGKMLAALSATPPTSGSGAAEAKLTVDAGLFSLDAEISATADAVLAHEPFGLYAGGNLTASLPGLELSRDAQVYAGEENAYCHPDGTDFWLRFRLGDGGEFEVAPADLTLEEQAGGYLLRGKLSIVKPEALAGTVLQGECHVDRETCLPTKILLDGKEFPAGSGDYVNQILRKAGLDLPAEVTSLRMELTELGYEPKAVPAAPQSGIDASRDFSDLTGADILKLLK